MKRIVSPNAARFLKGNTKTSVAALLALSVFTNDRNEKEHGRHAGWQDRLFQPSRTNTEARQKISLQTTGPSEKTSEKIKEYDFIIIGNGNAGKKAVQQLHQLCPRASIAVIDALRYVENVDNSNLHYYPYPATGFNPKTQVVELPEMDIRLKYRHSILLATGSRGAPPPSSLIDTLALSRVLEFRPTEISANLNRPVVPPETVRRLALLAATQEAKVCVLGSGWEALELAAAAVKTGKSSPELFFGSAAPLCHVLPRYLSTAVTKRLRNEGIKVHERTLVRYVSHHDASSPSRLEVHSAKAFDMLDTKRCIVDLLVLAPTVEGPRGTAILPIFNRTVSPILNDQSMGRTWYQSWSQMSSPVSELSSIVCFNDDGRISVSAELCAASRVYAAGSVAKYPNSLTGQAHVAGEGSVDGALAGKMAAQHMAYAYMERTSFEDSRNPENIVPSSFASKSFPIFRSDISPYNPSKGRESALPKVGITALAIGNCDAEKLSTHGFWWTSHIERKSSHSSKLRRKRTKRGDVHPIYGSGVIFYLDTSGKIRGVMTWGLPIATKSGELNQTLVDRLKKVVNSNGKVSLDLSQDEDSLLKTEHLEEETKYLAQIAYRADKSHYTSSFIANTKPLYRYTVAKHASVTSMGFLKRKHQSVSSELGSDDIYMRCDNFDDEIDDSRPPSLMYIYPMQNHWYRTNSNDVNGHIVDPFRLTKEERVVQAWQENESRARPPKEEPLWLRRDEINRSINIREAIKGEWLSNMKRGMFADGSAPYEHSKETSYVHESPDDFSQNESNS